MNRELVIQMYKDGLGIATIATRLRYTSDNVRKAVFEAGIMRTRKEGVVLAGLRTQGQKRKPYFYK